MMVGSFELSIEPPWFLLLAALAFGLNVGSFLNVVVFRAPRSCVTVNHPRWSFCPRCRRRLRWYENQPVLGWLMLRGRCGGCAMPISLRYPLVEALVGGLWLLAAWRWLYPPVIVPGAALVTVVALSMIVPAALIDLDLRLLPDRLTIAGCLLAPVGGALAPQLYGSPSAAAMAAATQGGLRDAGSRWLGAELAESLAASLDGVAQGSLGGADAAAGGALMAVAGVAVGAGVLWAILILGRSLFRRDVMGFGDVKFMGGLGGLLGPIGALVSIALACVLGSIGGLAAKLQGGRSRISEAAWRDELGPIARVALAPFRAERAELTQPVRVYRGLGALVARLVTGQQSMPFGPALAAAAIIFLLVPRELWWRGWTS